jgi:hypothetical protein
MFLISSYPQQKTLLSCGKKTDKSYDLPVRMILVLEHILVNLLSQKKHVVGD